MQSNIKGEKKSTFGFKIFVGISDEWDVVFVFKLFISFSFNNILLFLLILVFVYCG